MATVHPDICACAYKLFAVVDAGSAQVSRGVFENLLLNVCRFFLPHMNASESRRICQVCWGRFGWPVESTTITRCLCAWYVGQCCFQEEASRSSSGQPIVTYFQFLTAMHDLVDSWTASDDVRLLGRVDLLFLSPLLTAAVCAIICC